MFVKPQRANRLVIILALATVVSALGQSAATQPAATQPAAHLDPEIDKILTRLEKREVHDLHARLTWSQRYFYDEEGDAVRKIGEIWYIDTKPVAKFLIQFDAKISGQRKDKLDEKHLFDGEWYTELQSRTKTVTRRQVRRPKDASDPYKVGEGVFPLPFGQKKADILREFVVEKRPAESGDPEDTDHVRLIPREGTRTGQTYKRLDFWISREGPTAGLPVRVRVAKLDGTGKVNSYITISFRDAELNRGLSSGVFQIDVPAGYEEIVEPLEDAAAPAAPAAPASP